MGLSFIGLGLYNEKGISVRGLEEARRSDYVYVELYTNPMPNLSLRRLSESIGKHLEVVNRSFIEGSGAEEILGKALSSNVALLVPGDPMIATTHVALRIQAEGRGVKTRIIHGTSVASAAISLSGLHSYKFGRSVTIPFDESETPYNVIRDNGAMSLHSLVFLDVQAEERRYMTLGEGLNRLLDIERIRKENVATPSTLIVGLARVGSDDSQARAGPISKLIRFDFGPPPHLLIVPSRLHFTEGEVLVKLCGAPQEVVEKLVED
ncbi:MAG: diphthine synthase [Candidatus Bathyarchaeia archaeon]